MIRSSLVVLGYRYDYFIGEYQAPMYKSLVDQRSRYVELGSSLVARCTPYHTELRSTTLALLTVSHH